MKISFFLKSKQDPGISINHVMLPIAEEIGKVSNFDIQIHYLPSIGLNIKSILSNLWYIYRHRTKDGYNHVVGEVHYAIYALLGCKSVITVHDIGFWTDDNFGIIKRFCLYFTHLFPIKLANHIVAISKFTKDELLEQFPSIKDKISIIPSGYIDGFTYSPKNFQKSYPVILQNGVRPHKNLETTIKALKGIPCKLLVVRKMYDTQVQLAKELNIDFENVYDLTTEEVKETYRRADIVCNPSSYEGFGVIPIEAQAIGRPVITTNKEPMLSVSGGAAMYVNDPKNVEELHNALLRLIEDDQYRDSLIKKGLDNCKAYNLKNIVNNYIQIFCTI